MDDTLHVGRWITKEEKQFLLDLKPDDICKSLLQSMFADTYDVSANKIIRSKFNTFDQFYLEAKEYYNKERIVTNIGMFLVNKRVLEEHYLSRIGNQNKELTNKAISALNETCVQFAENSPEEYAHYIQFLDDSRWFADVIHMNICASMSLDTAKPLPEVQKLKKELLKKHEKELADKRLDVFNDIKKQLLDKAKEELKNNPGLELYESGARGSFDNAYWRMNVMVGPVYNAAKEEYEIVTNSLYDGYSKEEVATIANNMVSAFYPKSIGSGEAGYLTKKINAACQTIILDNKGTDCGTTNTQTMVLTPENIKFYMDSYMVERGKLVRLTKENAKTYAGKTVKMRTPDYCCGDKPCNICSGERFYIMGIKYAGLIESKLSGAFLEGKMKASHDMTVKTKRLTVDDMLS